MKLFTVVMLLLALVEAFSAIQHEEKQRKSSKEEAYATLLYGDYLLSVRVLGLSLKRSGTQREMVVLCTEEVSKKSRKILEEDGWTVKSISALSSPYKNYAKQYSKVFTKLLIWTLTDYRRIVFMDSDTLVYANIDELFNCGKFCAAYRHSDLFNSGVLVVKPDLQEYRNLINKIGVYPSYDNTDQGFLNYYYQSLVFAPMFNASNPRSQELPMRLPAAYNADVGQYYVYTSRFFPLSSYKVLHHTLGPVKPWKWWAYPIFDLNWHWVEVRDDLQPSPDSPIGLVLAAAFNLIPLLVTRRLKNNISIKLPRSRLSMMTRNKVLCLSVAVFFLLVLSYVLGFAATPDSTHPYFAIPAFCLWSLFFIQLFCFGVCLVICTPLAFELHSPTLILFLMVGSLPLVPLVVPLFIQAFFTRVCTFFTLIVLCFISSHLLITRTLYNACSLECAHSKLYV